MSHGGEDTCTCCKKTVCFAEEVRSEGRRFHKLCFVCSTCHKSLDSTTFTSRDDAIYCKECYSKKYGPKAFGFGQGAGILSTDRGAPAAPQPTNKPNPAQPAPRFGGAEKCARCSKSVYANEKVISAGCSWHKNGCFTCFSCGKSLESTTVNDGNGELYCKGCYGRKFGPKGYGYGGGAGTLTHTQ